MFAIKIDSRIERAELLQNIYPWWRQLSTDDDEWKMQNEKVP
jgi:hypothetical protein